jgi:hypothetical protein
MTPPVWLDTMMGVGHSPRPYEDQMIPMFRFAGRPMRVSLAPLFAVLALCAITVRALLPPGFMLVASQDPRALIAMTLCSGVMSEAASEAAMAAGTREGTVSADGEPNLEAHDCAACGLSVPVLAPIAPDMGEAFCVVLAEAAPPSALIPGRGLAAPPPPQTGPPVLI